MVSHSDTIVLQFIRLSITRLLSLLWGHNSIRYPYGDPYGVF